MALYDVNFAKHETTTGGVQDEVTLANEVTKIEVFNENLDASIRGDYLYVTVTGDDASVGGDDNFCIYPGFSRDIKVEGKSIVKLISTNAVSYSVTGSVG